MFAYQLLSQFIMYYDDNVIKSMQWNGWISIMKSMTAAVCFFCPTHRVAVMPNPARDSVSSGRGIHI